MLKKIVQKIPTPAAYTSSLKIASKKQNGSAVWQMFNDLPEGGGP